MATRRESRRRPLYILALLGLIGLVLYLFLGNRTQPKRVETAVPQEAPAPPAPDWVLVPPAEVAKVEAGRKSVDKSRVGLWMLSDPNLPLRAANSLIVARFPRDSLPLTSYQTDQLEPNKRHDSRSPVNRDDGTVDPDLQVLFTADRYRFVGDQPLAMSLEVFRGSDHVQVQILSAAARAKTVDMKQVGPDLPVQFTDSGDRVYHSTLKLSGTPLEKLGGRVDVEVEFDPGDGKRGSARLDTLYQPGGDPPARFTGSFREELENGSLAIYAGIEVFEAGPYMIEANLFDADRKPAVYMIGRMLEFVKGTSEVRLEAFGRVIHERDAKAPFTVANLRGYLFYPGKDPDRKLMPDYPSEYHTHAYSPDDFSDEEFWDEHKETIVRSLLEGGKKAPPGSGRAQTIGQAYSQGWRPQW
jgi:hypothetical protein